ncbi:hypothetical protein [Streptomyces althioticus]|uniref:hypothetical protein n=1 Tax=Streptomyces althioticus TaxID=83380 RepID=UPI0036FF0AE5
MGRGGTSRSAGAFSAPLLAVLAAALTVTGCTTDDSGTRASARPASTATAPSPEATSDVDLCVSIVRHWSREVLDGRGYGDYQSMGMSGGQYDILREVVDAARAARRQGTRNVDMLTERQAREGCTAWYRSGGPGERPWR